MAKRKTPQGARRERPLLTACNVSPEEMARIKSAAAAEDRPVAQFNRRAIMAAVEAQEQGHAVGR